MKPQDLSSLASHITDGGSQLRRYPLLLREMSVDNRSKRGNGDEWL